MYSQAELLDWEAQMEMRAVADRHVRPFPETEESDLFVLTIKHGCWRRRIFLAGTRGPDSIATLAEAQRKIRSLAESIVDTSEFAAIALDLLRRAGFQEVAH